MAKCQLCGSQFGHEDHCPTVRHRAAMQQSKRQHEELSRELAFQSDLQAAQLKLEIQKAQAATEQAAAASEREHLEEEAAQHLTRLQSLARSATTMHPEKALFLLIQVERSSAALEATDLHPAQRGEYSRFLDEVAQKKAMLAKGLALEEDVMDCLDPRPELEKRSAFVAALSVLLREGACSLSDEDLDAFAASPTPETAALLERACRAWAAQARSAFERIVVESLPDVLARRPDGLEQLPEEQGRVGLKRDGDLMSELSAIDEAARGVAQAEVDPIFRTTP